MFKVKGAVKIGKCSVCKKKKKLFYDVCGDCHGKIISQAQRDGMNENKFIGMGG